MRIWVDADACPKIIKEIIYKAAIKRHVAVVLVSNQVLTTPNSPYIKKIQVPLGPDGADNEIVAQMVAGELVITADIPLAALVIEKGGVALNPRGERYTPQNVRQCLAIRDFHTDLRGTGMRVGGPATLSKKEIQAFGNGLDQFLTSNALGFICRRR